MRKRYPAATLVILADLVKTAAEPDPHATEAARSVGGLLAIPDFGPERPEGAKDFNDLAMHCGRDALSRAIASTKAPDNETTRFSNKNASSDVLVDFHRNAPIPDPAMLYG